MLTYILTSNILPKILARNCYEHMVTKMKRTVSKVVLLTLITTVFIVIIGVETFFFRGDSPVYEIDTQLHEICLVGTVPITDVSISAFFNSLSPLVTERSLPIHLLKHGHYITLKCFILLANQWPSFFLIEGEEKE
jgi:hypothetical protein